MIRAGSEVTVTQLLASGRLQPQEVAAAAERMANQQSKPARSDTSLALKNVTESGAEVDFDVLAYMAPGMALMFLMFTVSNGGRTLLAEQRLGTLPRLLVPPSARPGAGRQSVRHLPHRRGADVHPDRGQHAPLPTALGRSAGRDAAGAGRGGRRGGLGDAHHRPGAHPRPGLGDRLGRHAHLWHPGRQLRQPGEYAGLVPGLRQNHPQRLGPGRVHHPGAGREAGQDPHAHPGAAADGCGAVRRDRFSSSPGADLRNGNRRAP